jgi:aminopeptidase N
VPVTAAAFASGVSTPLETRRLLLAREPAQIPLPPGTDWVVVNVGATGFYRVAYDTDLWNALVAHFSSLSVRERLSLVADTWAIVLAQRAPLRQYVQLLRCLEGERDPDVWAAALSPFPLLDAVATEGERRDWARLLRAVTAPAMRAVGYTASAGEDARTMRTRAELLRVLGTLGEDGAVIQWANQAFQAHLEGRQPLPPDLLPAVLDIVAYRGGPAEWERIAEQFRHAQDPQEVLVYLGGLAAFRDPDAIQRSLDLLLSPAVRTQDAPGLLARMLSQRASQSTAWERVEREWDTLGTRYPVQTHRSLLRPAGGILDDALAARIDAWIETHPVPHTTHQLAATREMQGVHRAFRDRYRGNLHTELA